MPRFPIYDLHSHTLASDGMLTPTQLVQRAVEMRVSVLAITDHDTTAGLAEAADAISRLALPLRLINGVEISTAWEGFDIHILGLGIDPQSSAMVALLADQAIRRQKRAEEIARRLEKNQVPDALAGAKAFAGDAGITRAHFARYLVEIGKASNMAQVFKKYLAKGKTGYVPPQWCTIKEAVDAIHLAGGQAALAHPSRYDLSPKWLRRLIVNFKQDSGDAIEVAQCQQAPDERTQLARYAEEYQLLASQGSDFHGPCAWLELGRRLSLPDKVIPVWQDWFK
ncbi:RNase RNM [Budvicia diplopodorum]|uniref:RNase RNM n=1 Tax=Budvicia diplopodorum TaxID=1119056 RepID=UPI0013586933|nr:PHP domain-containing protein [Budvicia diplopodorum]